MTDHYTIPGLDSAAADEIVDLLDGRMVSLIDLALTLKHVHWNVVGAGFIAVHEMLDPQVDAVRLMSDALAERIAALGGTPVGTPGALVARRTWDDYGQAKAPVADHLAALDVVYTGVIEDHRLAQSRLAELDPVSEDMVIGQLGELEQFQWFIRAHLEK
ncbi:MAG: DNA starvation/stationary phase protection protein [Acidimicrobiia bacterium]